MIRILLGFLILLVIAGCSSAEDKLILEKQQELLALYHQQVKTQQALEQRCAFLAPKLDRPLIACHPPTLLQTRQHLSDSITQLSQQVEFRESPWWKQKLQELCERLRHSLRYRMNKDDGE